MSGGLPTTDALPNPFPALDAATEAALRESIRRFGVIHPVTRDQHGRTLDGFHRTGWNVWARKRSGDKWHDLHEKNGCVRGYWVCGRPYGKLTLLHGDYPHTFLERALHLFDRLDLDARLLHAPSGILTSDPKLLREYRDVGLTPTPGVTVDICYDDPFDPKSPPTPRQRVPRRPQHVASVDDMPFEDETFDLVLTDTPYTRDDELKYDPRADRFPLRKAMREFHRVIRPGGYVGMLHVYTGPPRSNKLWATRATIAVAPSTQMNHTRTFSILQKKAESTFGGPGDLEP